MLEELGVEGNRVRLLLEEGRIVIQAPPKAVSYTHLNVVLVSRKAVTTEDGKSYVRILEDGAVHKRYVVVGWDDLKSSVWIAKGVEPGQTLIIG